jgi:hypothetical protein
MPGVWVVVRFRGRIVAFRESRQVPRADQRRGLRAGARGNRTSADGVPASFEKDVISRCRGPIVCVSRRTEDSSTSAFQVVSCRGRLPEDFFWRREQ